MKHPALALLLCLAVLPAHAATFQYIFNNVEQGSGGTSSPSISIDGEGQAKKSGAAKNSVAAPSLTTNPEATATSVAEAGEIGEASPAPYARFRLMATGARITEAHGGSAWSRTRGDLQNIVNSDADVTAGLAATIFASRDIGFTGFWLPGRESDANRYGRFGAEMEFIPVRVAVLGNTDFIEAGALLGASTFGREALKKAGTLHAGARLNVNFHSQLGITGAARTNFTDRRSYRYAQAELGLAYRF